MIAWFHVDAPDRAFGATALSGRGQRLRGGRSVVRARRTAPRAPTTPGNCCFAVHVVLLEHGHGCARSQVVGAGGARRGYISGACCASGAAGACPDGTELSPASESLVPHDRIPSVVRREGATMTPWMREIGLLRAARERGAQRWRERRYRTPEGSSTLPTTTRISPLPEEGASALLTSLPRREVPVARLTGDPAEGPRVTHDLPVGLCTPEVVLTRLWVHVGVVQPGVQALASGVGRTCPPSRRPPPGHPGRCR